MSRLMTYRTLLACLLAALLALLVAGQQQRAFERIWFKLEQRYGGDVARENALRLADYRVDIEARVLGAESNVSALSFDPSRRSLVSVTNQDPHFLELSLDGELLRRIPLRGFQDPEAIEYIRPGVYVVAEERRQRLVEIHVDADTRVIDIDDPRNARSVSSAERMPAALPAVRMRWMASSMAACTSGWPGLPRWPMAALRSAGPMNTPSTPSTAAIASRLARPSRFSTWTSRHICSSAWFRYSATLFQREARASALPTPRTPAGG